MGTWDPPGHPTFPRPCPPRAQLRSGVGKQERRTANATALRTGPLSVCSEPGADAGQRSCWESRELPARPPAWPPASGAGRAGLGARTRSHVHTHGHTCTATLTRACRPPHSLTVLPAGGTARRSPASPQAPRWVRRQHREPHTPEPGARGRTPCVSLGAEDRVPSWLCPLQLAPRQPPSPRPECSPAGPGPLPRAEATAEPQSQRERVARLPEGRAGHQLSTQPSSAEQNARGPRRPEASPGLECRVACALLASTEKNDLAERTLWGRQRGKCAQQGARAARAALARPPPWEGAPPPPP